MFLDGGSIFFIIFKIKQIIEKWALKGFDFDFLTISNFDFGITNESRSILHLVGDNCKTQFQLNIHIFPRLFQNLNKLDNNVRSATLLCGGRAILN